MESSSPNTSRTIVACAIIGIATLMAYWGVWNCDFLLYDDPDYVTENRIVIDGFTPAGLRWAFTSFHAGNWHPVTWMSHMLDHEMFGPHPSGHHAASLVLHVLNTLLLFAALRSLTGRFWPAVVVAVLFGVHPINVESVAWITERKNVLSATFAFLTLLAYAWYTRRPGAGRYLLVAVSLALGLMAKPAVVTLPCVLLLLDYWPLSRLDGSCRSAARLLAEKVPLLALSLVVCMITIASQRSADAVSTSADLPIGFRLANAVVSYVLYMWKLVWPTDLGLIYIHPSLPDGQPPWPLLAVAGAGVMLTAITLAVMGASLCSWRRRFLIVGWLWFLGVLVPMIGIVQVGSQAMADRFAYLSFIGLFIIVAWTAHMARRSVRMGSYVAIMAGVCALILLCQRQVQFWKDTTSIFERSLAIDPDNYVAHNIVGLTTDSEEHLREAIRIYPTYQYAIHNLGLLHLKEGRTEDALAQLARAHELDQHRMETLVALASAYNKDGEPARARALLYRALARDPASHVAHLVLGRMYWQEGLLGNAEEHLRNAMKGTSSCEARIDLARLLLSLDRLDESEALFLEATRTCPESVSGFVGLGRIHLQRGDPSAAVSALKRAADLDTSGHAHRLLALAYVASDNTDQAVAAMDEAVAFNADHVAGYLELSRSLMARDRRDAAQSVLRAGIRDQPDYAPLHRMLGILLGMADELDESILTFSKALDLEPDDPITHYNLGVVLLKAGRTEDAVLAFRQALTIDPRLNEAREALSAARERVKP